MIRVGRREFISLLGYGMAASWPPLAHAQSTDRMRRVGALIAFAEKDAIGQASATAFRQGLEQLNWVEGRGVVRDDRL